VARRRGKSKVSRIIASARLDMSVTQTSNTVSQVKELWESAEKDRRTAARRQDFADLEELTPDQKPTMPRKALADMTKIADTALTPNAKGIIDQFSQQMRVEGIRMKESEQNAPAWQLFTRNRLASKQVSLYKSMFAQGLAYGLVLPAVGRLDGAATAAFDLRSARRATAFYRDDFDEFPEVFLDVDRIVNSDGTAENIITFVDDAYIHRLSCPEGDIDKLAYIDNTEHAMGICPVQRFGYMDLDGNARGEVEPYLPLLQRIDQDTSDRLVLQRFSSWMMRWATGVEQPDSPEQKAALEAYLAVGDLLMNESPEAKFGQLQATPMDGHIRAREADIRDLSAVSQVPSYRMLGLADNIGAEAIAAADASLKRKMDEYKTIVGEQMESMLRLGGYAMGNSDIANDFDSRVVWGKTDAIDFQSLAQGITTLYANGEGIPMEMMWERLDGWSQQDTEEAKRLREAIKEAKQAEAMLLAAMGGGEQGGGDAANEAGGRAQAGAGQAG
jgi:hypothetical protein